jgi:putative tricarboxylic transport membrane protein
MEEEVQKAPDNGPAVVSVEKMEIGVALVFLAFSALVMVTNYRLGASWGRDGPQAGYFPFYVGVLMFIASIGILIEQIFRRSRQGEVFVKRKSLIRVFQILVPTAAYVALTAYIGIYVATAILIALAMIWLGRYRPGVAVPVAVAISGALFMIFEVWFLVPLPKGPLEAWLGY